MTIHFVYAGDANVDSNKSPYSITYNLYKFLAARVQVTYHRWDACYDIDLGPDDILLGHPHYDPNTVIQRAFKRDLPCRARYLIHPFHHRRVEDNFPFDHLARAATKIFSICGPYWYDTIGDTVFAHWKEKMVRVDMAIDLNHWPYRKTTFNAPGNRGVVYVGSGMPQKNVGLLTEIAKRLPEVRFDWYGGSGDHSLAALTNTHVEGWTDFTPQKVAEICYRNDLFVNVSISDANPTTLLEFGLASGIVPLVTETSGYWRDDCFINIPLNAGAAATIIKDWLQKPSEELQARSLANRTICEQKYTWERFCQTIWDGMMP